MINKLLPGTHELIERLIEILSAGENIDNRRLVGLADTAFGGTRAQGVYTPRDAYDALETAVNKYLSKRAADLIRKERDGLAELRSLIARLPTQTDRTREQTEFQQFSTPPTLAFLAARLLGAQTNQLILEPSAGTGSLAIWARALGARVVCNEINDRRRNLLTNELGFEAQDVDGAMINDLLAVDLTPTAIIMNPPFTATGGRVKRHESRYGLLHVESALHRLGNGGRLVAILGEAVSFDHPALRKWWEKIAREHNVRANLGVPGKEYLKYGTSIGTQILVIEKTGPTPGKTFRERLDQMVWGNSKSIEEAWKSLTALMPEIASSPTATGIAANTSGTIFLPYVPRTLRGGKPHPAVIVESASMAGVVPPDITYHPRLPREIVTEGKLSDIQLERVIYAGQRHEQRLPDGARCGFFVGDGTGVGKGRVLAGIISDNWCQGRQRALWLSVSKDLIEAARCDLEDLGMPIPLARINDYPANGTITLARGVLFSSYASLISAAKDGSKRLDQIQKWLGPDAVIIIDEAHKAKNALASGKGEPTQTGMAVIDLQDSTRNPDYRVVYSSATGATDVRNMAYMTRLGLWGPSTSFPNGFTHFLDEIDRGGVGAMEMVSRDMKGAGMYLSGSISFGVCPRSGKAVEYRERIHILTPEQRRMYNCAAAAWQLVLQRIETALDLTNGGNRARGVALNKFWGDHQRFFRQVICAFKVGAVLAEAECALQQDKSVVISLVGTGEARTREQIARILAEGGSLEDLDFSPREIIAFMIDRAFPTIVYEDKTDPATNQTIQVPARDKNGNIVESKEALRLKQDLIDGLSALQLPENPLDQLVNYFGEENVAELTGRTRRLIRDRLTGVVEYRKRAPDGIAMDRVNLYGAEQFQSGKRRIAIISDAASMGISLHASNRKPNQQRRVHITLELGWSADKQLQCFGRTHRSDQTMPPEYVLVSTELGGEKRFSSTIARRLGSLGALTKGDRGAADNADWARYNFETEEGKAALRVLFSGILRGNDVPGLEDPKQTLRDIGLLVPNAEGGEEVRPNDLRNVPRFLNRVLALTVDDQKALVDYFVELFAQTVRHAKANGTFDEGVTDIDAVAVRLAKPPEVVYVDPITGAETTHHTLDVDRKALNVSFEEANSRCSAGNGSFYEDIQQGTHIMALPSGTHTDPTRGSTYRTFSIWKPEGGRMDYLAEHDLHCRYRPTRQERVRPWWTQRYSEQPPLRTSQTHLIVGAIIPLWQRLKIRSQARLRVVRVSTEDGQRIVGVEIPPKTVGQVLRALGVGRSLVQPDQIFSGVLEDGESVALVGDLQLKRSSIYGDPAIEVVSNDPNMFSELRGLGLINEQIQWKQRFFVPSDEQKGMTVLSALLVRYPAFTDEPSAQSNQLQTAASDEERTAREMRIIDLDEWMITPDVPIERGLMAVANDSHDEMMLSPDQTVNSLDWEVESRNSSGLRPLSEFPLSAFAARKRSSARHLDRSQLALFVPDSVRTTEAD